MTPTGKHELVPSHGGGVPLRRPDCPGEFLGEGKPGGRRLKTASWRSWDPSWTFKDGLVKREGGTNSIKPSQPADSHGKNKAKSRKAWRVGSVLWVFSKSGQELRFKS